MQNEKLGLIFGLSHPHSGAQMAMFKKLSLSEYNNKERILPLVEIYQTGECLWQ
ncbi:hypothetical protein [Sulfurirhabdus autotrophica]|uniref:hypothetical protein n=1 Tax=Sulfurirhabdus autotrophica TaxID=1706046 RepID=UPI0014051973|nr:hypothetical protein [Sulfurirhabdus autotrophica]